MHALDTSELDIGGSGRARDPGRWLLRVHAGDDLGDTVDDLVLVDDAQVAVRNQGQCATAATLVRLEHDGAGLRGGDVGISNHSVRLVQGARIDGLIVRLGVEALEEGGVHAFGVTNVVALAVLEDRGDGLLELAFLGDVHLGLVILESVNEHIAQLVRVQGALVVVVARGINVVGETSLLLGGADAA